ncbi:hypothetical protein ACFLYJ_03180 [Candidatus Cloacimonadota bacterium]
MRKRLILLLFVLFIFLNLLGDGPPSFTIHEVDIVMVNHDTLHCYIRTFPSYWNSPDAEKLKPITTGVDIKSMLVTIPEIVYIDDYYKDPDFGFLVDNDHFHYLKIDDMTVSEVIYIGEIHGFSEMFITTVSAKCITNLETSRIETRISILEDSQGTTYINFDPDVSSDEFAILLQAFLLKMSCEGGPVLKNPIDYDHRGDWNLDLYLSYGPSMIPYNEENISDKIEEFIVLKKTAFNQIMKINPKHKLLLDEIIKFQSSFIEKVEFLNNWYKFEISKAEEYNLSKLNRNLESDFEKLIKRTDETWQDVIKLNKDEIGKITYSCISNMWD